MTPRKTHPTLTPDRVASLSALARKIDAEETDDLKVMGRSVLARHKTLRELILGLKAVRLERGMSLGEAGEKSGIGKANLSRLENDAEPNPTIDTVLRYAESLGVTVRFAIDAEN
jgi:DNA-binding XRE family transcriptional regulator